VIRDVVEFRRCGLACRRVADLNIPVDAWRAAMRQTGRRVNTPVHTFLIPPRPTTADERLDQLVYAVRTDPPPEVIGLSHGLLWWRRTDELTMPLSTVRAAVRRFARAEGVLLHTFLATMACAQPADPQGRRIYAVWAQHGPDPFSIISPPLSPSAVIQLATYTARHARPSTSDQHSPPSNRRRHEPDHPLR
jgi:hypothetical protein